MTGSIARQGSFKGEALIVAAGTDVAKLTDELRLKGIYTGLKGPRL